MTNTTSQPGFADAAWTKAEIESRAAQVKHFRWLSHMNEAWEVLLICMTAAVFGLTLMGIQLCLVRLIDSVAPGILTGFAFTVFGLIIPALCAGYATFSAVKAFPGKYATFFVDKIFSQLAEYEPLDRVAYSQFQKQTAESSAFVHKDFLTWIAAETAAIKREVSLPPLTPEGKRFVNKKI